MEKEQIWVKIVSTGGKVNSENETSDKKLYWQSPVQVRSDG